MGIFDRGGDVIGKDNSGGGGGGGGGTWEGYFKTDNTKNKNAANNTMKDGTKRYES